VGNSELLEKARIPTPSEHAVQTLMSGRRASIDAIKFLDLTLWAWYYFHSNRPAILTFTNISNFIIQNRYGFLEIVYLLLSVHFREPDISGVRRGDGQ